jgi:AraC-like DNA-binding protein
MIAHIDIAVRLVTCGAAILLLLLVVTGEIRRGLKLPLAGLLIGSVAYLLNSSRLIVHGTPVQPWVDLLSIFTPFFTWLFALRLFEREPDRRIVWAAALVLLGAWIIGYFVFPHLHIGFYIIHLLGLALVADLVRNAFSGRADDLVEKRRMLRLWLPLLVAAQAGGILAFELITGIGSGYLDPRIQLGNAILILALVLFAGRTLLRTEPQLLVESEAAPMPSDAASELSPSEVVLRDKLTTAMAAGHYRFPGLTIAGLAAHLEVPEHRLRSLINRRLGHRNFAAFLNGYRIAEAQQVLADRGRVDLPVLTIAMDLGYNSLPTFNRAFRVVTGQTPTDFRRAAIGQN